MNSFKWHGSFRICLALGLLVTSLAEAEQGTNALPATLPNLDDAGRFWVYRDGPTRPPMPFTPYGWMSDATNVMNVIDIDLECTDRPWISGRPGEQPDTRRCIRMTINWEVATWAGVAFISGSDKLQWWGTSKEGRHYNLSRLAYKRLVFYVRGEHGGEQIQAQFGILGDKPFGDSLKKPVTSEELKLTTEWVRYEVDFKTVQNEELANICNGFGLVVERALQSGSPNKTQFYIDNIYYE